MKTLILILSIFLTSFNLLSAEESYDITIHVKGMVCDFCARSVEKTFGSTKVVESINVDLDNGVIELKLKEGETLTDEKIKKLIKANGYALESIERTE
jgi:mercuric ion binding protein